MRSEPLHLTSDVQTEVGTQVLVTGNSDLKAQVNIMGDRGHMAIVSIHSKRRQFYHDCG